MKHLIVSVAGLGWEEVNNHWKGKLGDLAFNPADSVFPAVTCTAQASFRTASPVRDHGMVSNGVFLRDLNRPSFWEQSAKLVQGTRIWAKARAEWRKVAILFWQQSLGEEADIIISPAPIHKHGGGMIMANYAKPADLGPKLEAKFGTFPLHRYWGPLASPKVGDAVTGHVEETVRFLDPDIVFAYLPTLDYDLQRFGPESPRCDRSFKIVARELKRLAELAGKHGADLTVFGDYAIAQATDGPVLPNTLLRKQGYFRVRELRGMAYPDFYESRAFAMCDHEVAHVYVRDPKDIRPIADLFAASGDYDDVLPRTPDASWGHPNAGDLLLVARKGSWCAYPWWHDNREAPDYATHVDIHNKPGYDPCELFFGRHVPPSTSLDGSRIRGTHGRRRPIAYASTCAKGQDLVEIASSIVL